MKHLVTGKEMQLLDKNTSEHFHVPAAVLMEQAAMVFVRKLLTFIPENSKILVICGIGNNGADGIAIARLLNQKGLSAAIFTMQDFFPDKKGSELFELQKTIYRTYGYPELFNEDLQTIKEEQKSPYDVVIDAIFGIGLSRDISGRYADIVDYMNMLPGTKVAVDIATGVSADSGKVLGSAVKCDATITFSFGKIGQYLWPGTEYSGKVYIESMGITPDSWLNQVPSIYYFEAADLAKQLPKRIAHSNKGTYGKLLVIAGGPGMAGAASFAARAAYRSGTGLVSLFTHEMNRTVLQTAIPEAVIRTFGDKPESCEETLQNALEWADAIVIGPGLGTGDTVRHILYSVLSQDRIPVIADADALNMIADNPECLKNHACTLIITPHLGEMSRLSGFKVKTIQENLPMVAKDFAEKWNVICVLKDFHTITATPKGLLWLNLSGNNGMATGGSGDVLSGIIGALLAQGQNPEKAAPVGVFLHGLAGDAICKKTGVYSMMASDIIDGITIASQSF